MKRKIIVLFLTCILCTYLCACVKQTPKASPIEDFEYKFDDGCTIITGYIGTDFDIVIPSSIADRPVTTIAEEAFKNYDLKSIVIPYGVTEIGYEAFYGCSCLKHISLPDTVQIIGEDAFKETFWYDNYPTDSILYIDNVVVGKKGSIGPDIVIKEGTKSIVDEAFFDYNKYSPVKDYTNIYIPESVEYIGSKLGYYYSPDYSYSDIILLPWKRIEGFTITGKPGTTAETYANENSIKFISN